MQLRAAAASKRSEGATHPQVVATKRCEHGDSYVDSAGVLPPRKDVAAAHEDCGVC